MIDVLGKQVSFYSNVSDSSIRIYKGNLPKGLYFLNLYESGREDVLGSYKLIID